MSLAGKLWRIAACMLLYLALFDIGGVVVSLVCDILPLRDISRALYYAIWFVGGVFCGSLHYQSAGGWISPKAKTDWMSADGATATGRVVCAVSILLLIALTVLFFRTIWSGGGADDSYVPDNIPLTMTFFVAVAGAIFLAHSALRPAPKKC